MNHSRIAVTSERVARGQRAGRRRQAERGSARKQTIRAMTRSAWHVVDPRWTVAGAGSTGRMRRDCGVTEASQMQTVRPLPGELSSRSVHSAGDHQTHLTTIGKSSKSEPRSCPHAELVSCPSANKATHSGNGPQRSIRTAVGARFRTGIASQEETHSKGRHGL
jgi:hypothetical protein